MSMGGSVVSNNILNGKGKLKWCVRAHSPDPGAPKGSNARLGWITE